MRHAAGIGCLLLCGVVGCAGGAMDFGFGPYPTSGGGQLTAGVAGFTPGLVPQEGEYSLVIVNTDSRSSHMVSVSPLGELATTRVVGPCSAGSVAVPCTAATVLVELLLPGQAAPSSITLVPLQGTCTQRIVYISVPIATGTGDGTGGATDTTTPPSLTETVPASSVNCLTGGSTGMMGGQ